MKLGEALSERARLQRRISELRTRINSNTHVRKGEEVAENANDLIQEVVHTTRSLEILIVRINMANTRTLVDERPLTEWLAVRDTMASLVATYSGAADSAQERDRRDFFGRGETSVELVVDVPDLRAKADEMLEEMRRIDNKIQAANWMTEI